MRLSSIKAVCLAAVLSSPLIAYSQNYYVVVGAFAANERASEFKGFLPEQYMDTSYSITDDDKQLRFYVVKTEDEESAISKSQQLWKVIESLRGEKGGLTSLHSEISITAPPAVLSASDNTTELSGASASAGSVPSSSAGSAGYTPPKPVGKYFKFQIETPDGEPVAAPLHHVDFSKGRELASYKSHTFVDLVRPGTSNEPMAVVCGLFGYKEIFKYIDYSDPSRTVNEAYVDEQGAWVIPYKLERVEKGDVSPMYNVSFYKDAAIMRQSSTVDLDELVSMMRLNPYYEITIHAHCNGKHKREIIAPGAERNYFDAEGSVKLKGTAKDLTTLRAEAVRSYLMDHGVDPARIEIFSWGASDMLVKDDSPNADLNNRIEIEFTRD